MGHLDLRPWSPKGTSESLAHNRHPECLLPRAFSLPKEEPGRYEEAGQAPLPSTREHSLSDYNITYSWERSCELDETFGFFCKLD